MEFGIDFGNEPSEMQLLGELPSIEIADGPSLNFAGIYLGVINRLFSGLDDKMPDCFTLLLQVALKIGASAAENVDRFSHSTKIYPRLRAMSCNGGALELVAAVSERRIILAEQT